MVSHVRSDRHTKRTCSKDPGAGKKRKSLRWLGWLLPVVGLASLIWFLVRVIPKPSRAVYPCQRVAAPIASSFVTYLLGLSATFIALHKARERVYRSRYVVAALCVAVGLGTAFLTIPTIGLRADATARELWVPSDPPNAPMGVGRGVHPGRVVWVHDREAADWDGATGYWWEDRHTDPAVVRSMMSRAVRWLTGEADDGRAWDAVFREFNRTHGHGNHGYRPGEKIAIKINLVQSPEHAWSTNLVNPSPQMVEALLEQLVTRAGVDEWAITVYDAIQRVGDPIYDRCHAVFPEVRFADGFGGRGRIQVQRNADVRIHYGDPTVLDSGQVCLPDFVVEATYFVNLALLKPHELGGVTLCAKNQFGSIWRPTGRSGAPWHGWDPDNLHETIAVFDWCPNPAYQCLTGRPMDSFNPVVDLMGHEHLGGKTLLYLIEGLYTTPVNQGGEPAKWLSPPFNNDWTSSLFVSQDGVAIDSVALDFLRSEPTKTENVRGSVDNYLHEAARAHDPPSGMFYDPEGDGTRLDSLGVHEHWNNGADKQYTRNLGGETGIELVSAPPLLDRRVPSAVIVPAIDGSMAIGEWDDALILTLAYEPTLDSGGSIYVRDPRNLGLPPHPEPVSPSDYSSIYYFKWDDTHLYMANVTTDNEIVLDAAPYPPDLWVWGDTAELGFSFLRRGGDNTFWVTPPARIDGPTRIETHDMGEGTYHDVPNATIAGTITAPGYVVEVAFPWSDIDPGYTPAAGDVHGMTLGCADFDGDDANDWGDVVHFMSNGRGTWGNCFVSGNFNNMILVTNVCEPPAITRQPTPQTGYTGATAVFSLAASGTNPSYQWQVSADGAGFHDVTAGGTGHTSNSYTTDVLTRSDNGRRYRCVVSNYCGQAVSEPVTLAVWDRADFDQDGDVDQTDFGHLQRCYTDPGDLVEGGCANADLDDDQDVDATDVSWFQSQMTGAVVRR